MSITIEESVTEKLVYIGVSSRSLRPRVSGRIFHALMKCPPYGPCVVDPKGSCQMSNAEKEAIAQGRPLRVSWAELGDGESAKVHEAALLCTYKELHGRLPGIMGRDNEWVPGPKKTPSKQGPLSDLAWGDWHPMDPGTIHCVSRCPGVYRIRVA